MSSWSLKSLKRSLLNDEDFFTKLDGGGEVKELC
jgi:hypothetical protein